MNHQFGWLATFSFTQTTLTFAAKAVFRVFEENAVIVVMPLRDSA